MVDASIPHIQEYFDFFFKNCDEDLDHPESPLEVLGLYDRAARGGQMTVYCEVRTTKNDFRKTMGFMIAKYDEIEEELLLDHDSLSIALDE